MGRGTNGEQANGQSLMYGPRSASALKRPDLPAAEDLLASAAAMRATIRRAPAHRLFNEQEIPGRYKHDDPAFFATLDVIAAGPELQPPTRSTYRDSLPVCVYLAVERETGAFYTLYLNSSRVGRYTLSEHQEERDERSRRTLAGALKEMAASYEGFAGNDWLTADGVPGRAPEALAIAELVRARALGAPERPQLPRATRA